MAKGKGTATPAKVRAQREAAEALKGGNGDAAEILKALEEQEREARQKFEEEQRQRREKALEKVLEPLRKRREQLDQAMRDAETEIADVDRQIAKLTGAPEKKSKGGGAGGKRSRIGAAEIAAAVEKVLGVLPPHSSSDYMGKGDVASKAGLGAEEVSSALAKMKREGQAESNGVRGTGGGWRKAAK